MAYNLENDKRWVVNHFVAKIDVANKTYSGKDFDCSDFHFVRHLCRFYVQTLLGSVLFYIKLLFIANRIYLQDPIVFLTTRRVS